MTDRITFACLRTYSDTGQTVAVVEWMSGSQTSGDPDGTHMKALMARAEREGLVGEKETW